MQDDIDFTWAHPTERQLAALNLVRQVKPSQIKYAPPELGGFTELNAAECICTILGPGGLVYLQAQGWFAEPPKTFGHLTLEEAARSTWQAACGFVVAVLDLGYDPETKQWWNLRKLATWKDPKLGTLVLMDFGAMLRRCTQIRSTDDAIGVMMAMDSASAPPLVPASWWLLLDLICGRNWEKRYEQFVVKMMAARAAKR